MEYDCAPDGSFEPLQCSPEGQCSCVDPSSGALVPDTETTVVTRDDAPDCARLCKFFRRLVGLVEHLLHVCLAQWDSTKGPINHLETS